MGQVWYLIVSIPDICHFSYFDCKRLFENATIVLYISLFVYCLGLAPVNVSLTGDQVQGDESKLTRTRCVASPNRSQTRQICRIYIQSERVILEKLINHET